MCWWVGEFFSSSRPRLLVLVFGHPFQRAFERGAFQALAKTAQRALRGFAKLVGRGFGRGSIEGNLHLYADSANLTAPVLQLDDQIGRKLTQFGSDGGVGHRDAQYAQLQSQHLGGLHKMGRCYTIEVVLQGRQRLHFGQ